MTDDLHESTFCVTRPIRKNQSHACGICMYWIGQSHNLLPWKVSNWQFPMQHVTKISSKSRFLFSAIQLIWLDRKDSIAHSQEQWCYIFFYELWVWFILLSFQRRDLTKQFLGILNRVISGPQSTDPLCAWASFRSQGIYRIWSNWCPWCEVEMTQDYSHIPPGPMS